MKEIGETKRTVVKPMDLRDLPETREIFSGNIRQLRESSIAI